MIYNTVTINLRDVPPDAYQALMQYIETAGLYGRVSVRVEGDK